MNTEQEGSDRLGKALWTFLIIALVFFVGSVSIAAVTLFRGENVIRAENVELNINGPEEITSGETVDYEIEILNRNQVPLSDISLVIEPPTQAKKPEDINQDLSRERVTIEEVPPNGRATTETEMVLFGEEGDEHLLSAAIEYSIPDATNRFTKESEKTIRVGESPVSISISPRTEVHDDQPTKLDVNIRSRSDQTTSDLLITGSYPGGFDFVSSSPTPDHQQDKWLIGTLAPGETTTITVEGVFSGGGGEERTLSFSAGLPDDSGENIRTPLASVSRTVSLRPPHLTVSWLLPRMTDGVLISEPGRTIEGEIEVQNNLNVDLQDAEIELQLPWQLIDLDSVELEDRRRERSEGYFDRASGKVVWSYMEMEELEELSAGETIDFPLEFSFISDRDQLRAMRAPHGELKLEMEARQSQDPDLAGTIRAEEGVEAVLSTDAILQARGVHSVGEFDNFGPIPPRYGEETSYTVFLSLGSSFNDLEDVEVRAELPPYVEWADKVSPEGEDVTYRSAQREIIWRRDKVSAGRGVESSHREIAFQVVYEPRRPHQGERATLLDNIRLEGKDALTGETRETRTKGVTTEIIEDPEFEKGDEIVE